MQTSKASMPPHRIAGLVALLIVASAASYAVSREVTSAEASGSFSWPSDRYLRDVDGNWSYRNMWVSWNNCSGSSCYYNHINAYANIASPTSGYEYHTVAWGIGQGGWDNRAEHMTYSNTPKTMWGSQYWLQGFQQLPTDIVTVVCEGSNCGLPVTWGYGAALEAGVTSHTSAVCYEKRYPHTAGCW